MILFIFHTCKYVLLCILFNAKTLSCFGDPFSSLRGPFTYLRGPLLPQKPDKLLNHYQTNKVSTNGTGGAEGTADHATLLRLLNFILGAEI